MGTLGAHAASGRGCDWEPEGACGSPRPGRALGGQKQNVTEDGGGGRGPRRQLIMVDRQTSKIKHFMKRIFETI